MKNKVVEDYVDEDGCLHCGICRKRKVQDALYADSASEKIFTNLISIIGSDANIKMAYRNLKSNKGSSTPGVDGKTFKDLAEMSLTGKYCAE